MEWQDGEEILGDDEHVVGHHFWVGGRGVMEKRNTVTYELNGPFD